MTRRRRAAIGAAVVLGWYAVARVAELAMSAAIVSTMDQLVNGRTERTRSVSVRVSRTRTDRAAEVANLSRALEVIERA